MTITNPYTSILARFRLLNGSGNGSFSFSNRIRVLNKINANRKREIELANFQNSKLYKFKTGLCSGGPDPQWMCLGVENKFVQVKQSGIRLDKVEIL